MKKNVFLKWITLFCFFWVQSFIVLSKAIADYTSEISLSAEDTEAYMNHEKIIVVPPGNRNATSPEWDRDSIKMLLRKTGIGDSPQRVATHKYARVVSVLTDESKSLLF